MSEAAYEPTPERLAMDTAETAFAFADSDLEHAIMRGVGPHRKVAIEAWHEAHRALTVATKAWLDSLPRTFEDILRDPTSQMDPEGIVLKSIRDYQKGDVCGQPIRVLNATASTSFEVSGSVYICTMQRPCRDHPTTGNADFLSKPS